MIGSNKESQLDIALKELVFHKRMTGAECDLLRLTNDPVFIEKAKAFNKASNRLDKFWLSQVLQLRPDTNPLKNGPSYTGFIPWSGIRRTGIQYQQGNDC